MKPHQFDLHMNREPYMWSRGRTKIREMWSVTLTLGALTDSISQVEDNDSSQIQRKDFHEQSKSMTPQ